MNKTDKNLCSPEASKNVLEREGRYHKVLRGRSSADSSSREKVSWWGLSTGPRAQRWTQVDSLGTIHRSW